MLNRRFLPDELAIARQRIAVLDLEPIMVKLMDKKEGKGWSLAKTQDEVARYRNFLFLNAKYPDQRIVPTVDVDAVWHAHILDTMKYSEDCQAIFGCFFHHFPYFGIRGAEDAKALSSAFSETKRLYQLEFSGKFGVDASSICDGGGDGDVNNSSICGCDGGEINTSSICGCDGGEISPAGVAEHHVVRPRLADLGLTV